MLKGLFHFQMTYLRMAADRVSSTFCNAGSITQRGKQLRTVYYFQITFLRCLYRPCLNVMLPCLKLPIDPIDYIFGLFLHITKGFPHFFQLNIQFIRDKHSPNSAEREDIKNILKCMLDVSWAGKHGDHSTVCEMRSMTSIWFKLAQILLENVFPEGEIFTRMDTQGSVGSGGLFRSSSSGKGVSSRSLCKSKKRVND